MRRCLFLSFAPLAAFAGLAAPLGAQDRAPPVQGPTEDGEAITVQPRAPAAMPSPSATSLPTFSLPAAKPSGTPTVKPTPVATLPAVTAPATAAAPVATRPATTAARAASPPSGAARAPRASRADLSSPFAVAPSLPAPSLPAIAPPPDTAPIVLQPPVAAPPPVSSGPQPEGDGEAWPLLAGVLALAGLGAAALIASRRRRVSDSPEEPALAMVAFEPAEPVAPLEVMEEPAFPSAAVAAAAEAPSPPPQAGRPAEPAPLPRPSPDQARQFRPVRVLYGREAVEAFSRPPRRAPTFR